MSLTFDVLGGLHVYVNPLGDHHESTVAPNWPDTLLPAALSVVVILRKKKEKIKAEL
jgi:hypothetical protein